MSNALAKRPADDQAYRNFANPLHPWERQKGEGAKAFEGFTVFRNLGPDRSKSEAARRLDHKNLTTVQRWAVLYFWDERVSEWDADQERKLSLWAEADREEMVRRHSRIAISMLELVQQKLTKMLIDPEQAKYLTVADITQWVKVAADLERICKGGVKTEDDARRVANIVQIIWQGTPPKWAESIGAKALEAINPDL